VIFLGTPEFAVPALRAVAAAHEVAAVYCQPPRPAGRGQRPRPSPVQAAAERLGLPVRTPASLRDPAEQAAFAGLGADVAVVAAYGLILPRPVLEAPARGCLNIHASLLPRWRGAAPIHRAILAGDADTGISIMRMEAGLDSGPVLLAEATAIGADETTGDLHDRLAAMGARLVLAALDGIDRLAPVPQPETGITWAPKIDKAEAAIDWTRPAVQVDRQIRGLSPFPGAWTTARGERIKLLRCRLAPADGAPGIGAPGIGAPKIGAPGTVLAGPAGALTVACGEGAVAVTEAQREGRRAMSADELMRGLALTPGERLGA
jgi:methionyl-tRNA formyltransferase